MAELEVWEERNFLAHTHVTIDLEEVWEERNFLAHTHVTIDLEANIGNRLPKKDISH
jgi:uncharacterized protein with HEPN domain